MPQEATLGNVVLSRPFQFAETQTAKSNTFDGRVIWTPKAVQKPGPIKTRWIYAFETGERNVDQKPILAAEYHADEHGSLTFVAGSKRRVVDATEKSAPNGMPVRDAALPIARQGKSLRHAFVASRGRLSKRAIWEIENDLHPIFERVDLADVDSFKPSPDDPMGPLFLSIIDPFTIAESLSRQYHEALNEALRYTVPKKEFGNVEQVALRSRKYQLAKMIKDTLLAPDGEVTDPLDVRPYLAGNGRLLLSFVEAYESKVRKLDWQRRNAARELVSFLNSGIWGATFKWYMATQKDQEEIGYLWLDCSCRCIDRLSETREGATLIRQLVDDRKNGLLSYLFEPDEAVDEEAEEQRKRRFAVARKAATGVVIGITETAPALILHLKARAASRLIERTLKAHMKRTSVAIVVRAADGHVAQMLQATTETLHVDVEYKQAKVDLEKWMEEGKPHWPEGTKIAKIAEVLARLFIGIEVMNCYNTMEELREGKVKAIEGLGAVMDLWVAAEDPIRAMAKKLVRDHSVGRSSAEVAEEAVAGDISAGARSVITEAGEQEAKTLIEKLVAPAAFKIVGAASAAIDTWMNLSEAQEAFEHGDTGKATAKFTVGIGSALIAMASFANAAGYWGSTVALTAAASSLLFVGVLIVVIGVVLVATLSTSPWQKFARHCSFGDEPALPGHESWSGGNFSTWVATKDGLERQIGVLITMLCGFKVHGIGFDAHTITIRFGAIPPRARLATQFEIEYENDVCHRPFYLIDLETGKEVGRSDGPLSPELTPYRQDGRLVSMMVRARRHSVPEGVGVRSAQCSVWMHFGKGTTGTEVSGQIPVEGHVKYEIFDGSGIGRISQVDSMSVELPKKKND